MNEQPLWKSPAFWCFAAFAGWSCFYTLDALPVRLWDESRQATNSLEMLLSGNWLYTTFNGQPDFYNTKPPLLIWLQTLSTALFGYSEWSIRLPSALAGLATGLLLYAFVRRETKNEWAAMLAGISLMAAPGWIDEHVVRSGDYDALLSLWLTASWIAFYRFDQHGTSSAARAFLLFSFLAVFTKSTAGLMLMPGLFLWGLARGSIKKMLLARGVLWMMGGMLLLTGLWYLMHEHKTPGSLNAVWQNEVSARFMQPNEGHSGPWYYYLTQLAGTDFPYWPLALAGFAASLWLLRNSPTGFISSQLAAFLLLLSMSATKIEWYAAPALPMLAAGCGLLLAPATLPKVRSLIFAAAGIAILSLWSQTTLKRLMDPIELRSPGPEDELSLYLQGRHAAVTLDTAYHVVTTDYNPTAMLYSRWPGRTTQIRTQDWQQLHAGNRVIAWHAHQLDSLKTWYSYRLVMRSGHLHFLEIQGRAVPSTPEDN